MQTRFSPTFSLQFFIIDRKGIESSHLWQALPEQPLVQAPFQQITTRILEFLFYGDQWHWRLTDDFPSKGKGIGLIGQTYSAWSSIFCSWFVSDFEERKNKKNIMSMHPGHVSQVNFFFLSYHMYPMGIFWLQSRMFSKEKTAALCQNFYLSTLSQWGQMDLSCK